MACRVIIFHPALAPYRLPLFNALAKRCYLRIVLLRKNLLNQNFNQDSLTDELEANYGYLSLGFTLFTRTIRFGVWREIRAFTPDVVVSHEFSPLTLGLALRRSKNRKFKHVVWSADSPEIIKADNPFRMFCRRIALDQIDGLIVYTEETATIYRKRFGLKIPIGIVPNIQHEGVFRLKLRSADVETRIETQNYELMGRRVLLYVGRLSREKRVDLLIDAFSAIHQKFPNAVLVIVGGGLERGKLTQLVSEKEMERKIFFTGRCEGKTLSAWYRIGGLFVLPSEKEPFGAVVNEALMAGMPVICSRCAGARVLVNDGENGVVLNTADKSLLQSSISDWLMRIEPLSENNLISLRPSLMMMDFQGAVDEFISLIYSLGRKPHSSFERFNSQNGKKKQR